MKFPYHDDEPIVPLEIQAEDGKWYRFVAYVDSGAGYSVFHTDVAESLGLDLEKGRMIRLTVGDGSQIPVYLHKMAVKFSGYKFEAVIGFSPSLGIGTNILGQKDFFDRFRICFNRKKKILETKRL